MSLINDVPEVNRSKIDKVYTAFLQDNSSLKVDLIIGLYRSEDGNLYYLPVVKKTEKMVLDKTENHDYLSTFGHAIFSKEITKLLLGDIDKQWAEGTVFGVHSIGSTGALSVGATFLMRHMKCTTVYYPNPSWENHEFIFSSIGYQTVLTYRYLNRESKKFDFQGLCEDISNAPPNSVIIFHGCGHNPTGIDPNKEQWKKIAEIVKNHKLIPFFDFAYQGFSSGDPEEDAWAIRYFYSEKIQLICAHTCSKMFTMYNERVGTLIFVLKSADNIDNIKIHVGKIIRSYYSSPPSHGAKTVQKILTDPELFKDWLKSLKDMANRLIQLRKDLRQVLEELVAPGTWNHITDQRGMFIFLSLTDNQVEYLQKFHHVYMMTSGRINVSSLNKSNISYVAKAINDTLIKIPDV